MKPAVPYSEELAEAICERLAGGESLRAICQGDGMPNRTTVLRWVTESIQFAELYDRAREQHADEVFDQLVEIMGEEPPTLENGRIDPAWPHLQRNRLDTIKWRLARMAPKRYGDRMGVEIDANIRTGEMTQDQQEEGAKRIVFILQRAALLEGPQSLPASGDERSWPDNMRPIAEALAGAAR